MRLLFSKRYVIAILLSLATFVSLHTSFFAQSALAAAGIYRPINYQGKLSSSGGIAIANGTYNMRFKIFTQATGGVAAWTETWNGSSQRVTSTGGLFSIALGTHVTMTGSVDFNSDSLYLQVEFDPGNDGTYEEVFSPRRRFASVPYAHNANTLDGLDSTQFIRADQSYTASGTITIRPRNAAKIGIDIVSQGGSSATGALRLSTQGGPAIVFGSGGVNYDTNLYRASANTLKTDDALQVVGTFSGSRLNISGNSHMSGALLVKGNVGIGTTSPSKRLHVIASGNGTSSYAAQFEHTDSNGFGNGIYIKTTGSYSSYYGIKLNSGAGDVFTVANDGTVIGNSFNGTLNPPSNVGTYSMTIANTNLYAEGLKIKTSGNTFANKYTLYVENDAGVSLAIPNSGNVGIGTTTPGSKLSVSGAVIIGQSIGSAAAKAQLDVKGTISGSRLSISNNANITGALLVVGDITTRGNMSGQNLTVSKSASISGTLIVKTGITSKGSLSGSMFYGAGLGSCTGTYEKLLYNPSTGKFSCGAISTSSTFGTGNVLTLGDARYVKKQGDTMTGALVINVTGGDINTIGLKVLNTLSGAHLHAERLLTSSGMILGESGALLDGGTFYVDAGNNRVGIGTTSPSQALQVNGDILVGASVTGHRILDTGVIYFGRTDGGGGVLSGTSFEPSLLNGKIDKSTYVGGGMSRNPGAGAGLLVFGYQAGGGSFRLEGVQHTTDSTVQDSTIRGVSAYTSAVTNQDGGNVIIHGGSKATGGGADGDVILAHTGSSDRGLVGIGTTAPKAKLDVIGTISGSRLSISNNANITGALLVVGDITTRGNMSGQNLTVSKSASISGTLIVKTGITSKGSLSGSTFYGAGLGSCTGTYEKLLYNPSTGKFSCGAISTSSTFGTGNVVTIGDSRYVKKQGDTMTGALVIQNGNTHSPTTTALLNVRGTMSGRSLYISGTGSSPLLMTKTASKQVGINLTPDGYDGHLALYDASGSILTLSGNPTGYATIGSIQFRGRSAIVGDSAEVGASIEVINSSNCGSNPYWGCNNWAPTSMIFKARGNNTAAPVEMLRIQKDEYVAVQKPLLVQRQSFLSGAVLIGTNDNTQTALGLLEIRSSTATASLVLHGSDRTDSQEALGIISFYGNNGASQKGAEIEVMNDHATWAWGVNNVAGNAAIIFRNREAWNGALLERMRISSNGYVGIGSSAPKAQLDVVGTISGSRLSVSGNANITGALLTVGNITSRGTISGANLTVSKSASISGTLIVKTGITSKGSLSGSTFYGAGLGDCTGTYEKLLYNPSTGKFSCGAISTSSTFGTGNVVTIGDSRYVKKQGDTMTGALVIDITGGDKSTLGLRVMNTISGSVIRAQNTLAASGALIVKKYAGTGTGNILVVDTAGLVYDATNKRVGVGTATPSTKFHVYDSVNTDVMMIMGRNNPNNLVLDQENNPNNAYSNSANILFKVRDAANTAYDGAKIQGIYSATKNGAPEMDLRFMTRDETSLATRMTITATGAVGIGTATPSKELHILKTGGSTIRLANAATSMSATHETGRIEFYSSDTDNTNIVGYIRNEATNAGAVFATHLGSSPSSGQAATDLITLYNGNVGISDTTPDNALDIEPNTISSSNTSTTGIELYGDVAGNAGYLGLRMDLDNTSGDTAAYIRSVRTASTTYIGLEIGTESNHGIRFMTNGTGDSAEKMRLTPGGNLGIGTTSPGSKLSVSGSVIIGQNIGSATAKARLDVVGTISGSRLVISQNGAFSGSLVVRSNLSGSSLFGFGLGDCNNATTSKLVYNNSTGKFSCATDQTGGSSTFGTGNVMTLLGSYVQKGGDTMTGTLVLTPTAGSGVTALRIVGKMTLTGSAVLQSSAAGTVALTVKGAVGQTANLQEWQNSAGTVLTHLDKDGDVVVTQRASVTTPQFRIGTYETGLSIGGNDDLALISNGVETFAINTSAGTTAYTFKSGGVTKMTMTEQGLLGIGTTSPKAQLDVVGTISGSRLSISNTANISGALLVKGNVGIGTTSPSAQLHISGVNGNVGYAFEDPVSGNPKFGMGARTTPFGYMFFTAVSSKNQLNTVTRDFHINSTSVSNIFYAVAATGNVGIGTATPRAKLEVAGSISGATLFVQNMSGAGLVDCDASTSTLRWDATNETFSCGTGGGFSTGAVLAIGDARYVKKQGDTMTGALVINVTGGDINTVGLKVLNTLSGAHLHAERLLTSSGNLIVEGTGTFGAGSAAAPALRFGTQADGFYLGSQSTFLDVTLAGTQRARFGTSVLRIAGNGSAASPMFSSLTHTNGGLYFESGGVNDPVAISHASSQIAEFNYYRGSTLWARTAAYPGLKVVAHASQSGNLQEWQNSGGTPMSVVSALGYLGIGTSSPKAQLAVFGTISGSRLSISNIANISGALLVKGNVGIGTTSPTAKLHVAGTSRFTGTIASEMLYDGLGDDLILHLPFTEGSGTSTSDRSTQSMNATLSANVAWVSGRNGYAVDLDGLDDRIAVEAPDSSIVINNFTYSIWVNADTLTSGGARNYLFDLRGDGVASGASSYFLFDDQGSSKVTFTAGTNGNEVTSSSVAFATGTWHHIAATRTGSTLQIYLDGVLIKTGTDSGSVTLNNAFRIGTYAAATSGNYFLDGKIDDPRIHTRALSADEIREVYNRGLGTTAPYVATSGNVGIGTTTARAKLEVAGSISGATLFAQTFSGAGLVDCDATSQKLYWDSTTEKFSCGTDNNTGTFGTGNVLTIGDSRYVNVSGDTMTGILKISKSNGYYTGALLNVLGTMSGRSLYISGSGGSAAPLLFASSTNGLVGIGTNNAAFRLDVQTDQAVNIIGSTGYGAGNYGNFVARAARGTQASPSAVTLDDVIGAFSARGYTSSSFVTGDRARISMHAGENWAGGNNATYISFSTTPGASSTLTERMRILSTGQVNLSGNGTIRNNGGSTFILMNGDGNSQIAIGPGTGTTYQAYLHTFNETSVGEIFNIDGGTTIFNRLGNVGASTKVLQFRASAGHTANLTEWQNSAGTALAFVTPSGTGSFKALGIGLTTPRAKLEVAGSISGATLFVQNMSGAGLVDCDASTSTLHWDATNETFSCGTGGGFSTGAVLAIGDARYVKKQGDTMTGALVINVTGGDKNTLGLRVMNTISGSVIRAQNTLAASGALVVKKYAGTGTGNILVVDTTGLVYDATNKRVGVGTSSPSADLQVGKIASGSQEPNRTVTIAGYSTNTLEFNHHSGWTSNQISSVLNTGIFFDANGTVDNTLDVTFRDDPLLWVQGAGASRGLLFTGSAGVSRGTNLVANGDLTGLDIHAYYAIGSPKTLNIRSTSNGITLGTPDANSLRFKAGGSDVMTITATGGLVGIATTAPKAKLDVVGTISGSRLSISNNANISGALLVKGNVGIGTTNPNATLYVKGTTNVATLQATNGAGNKFLNFAYSDEGASTYGNFQIQSQTLVLQGGSFGGKLQLTPFNGGSYSASLGLIVDTTGNVGIGTATPRAKLEVVGSISGATLFVQNMSGAGLVDCDASTSTLRWDATNETFSCGTGGGFSTGAVLAIGDARYVKKQGDTMTGTLILEPQSGLALNARGTISGSLITQNGAGSNYFMGNVGIGITAPTEKLHVNGNMRLAAGAKITLGSVVIEDNGSARYISATNGLDIYNTSDNYGIKIGRNSYGMTTQGRMAIRAVGSSVDKMVFTIDDTAQAGVTIGQIQEFTYSNNHQRNWAVIRGGTNASNSQQGLSFLIYGGTSQAGTASGDIILAHNGIKAHGLVGIGTLAPRAQLDVVGTISGSRLSISNNANISGSLLILNNLTVRGTFSGATLHASSQLRSSGSLAVEGNTFIGGTIENGLIAWFPLDTSMGSSTVYTPDLSATAGSGKLVSAPTLTTGKFGRALSFDGTDDYVEISNPTLTNAVTVAGWARFDSVATQKTLAGFSDANSTSPAVLLRANSGFANFYLENASASAVSITGGTPLETGAWYHFVGVYNGTDMKIYVNGVSDATPVAQTGNISAINNSKIGSWFLSGAASQFMNGKLDDIRVYNRALSAREIADLYRSGSQAIGGTMSGVVILEGNASTLLNIRGTASGERLHANRLLTASGMILGESGALLDGGTFYVDAGNNRVGIGTLSPASLVDIHGSAYSSNMLNLKPLSAGSFYLNVSHRVYGGSSYGAFDFVQQSQGVNFNVMTFANGNVGINTTAPRAKLEVAGSISGATLFVQNMSGAGLVDCDAATSTLRWDATTEKFSCGTGGGFSTGAVLAIGDARYVKKQGDTMTGTLVLAPQSGLALNARGTISGSLITQNGAGDNYFLGNLSVGRTSTYDGYSMTIKAHNSSMKVLNLRNFNSDAEGISFTLGDDHNYIDSLNSLNFTSGAAQSFTFQGNVTPNTSGNFNLGGINNNAWNYIYVKNVSARPNEGNLNIHASTNTSNGGVRFLNASSSELMRVGGDGNVGIGTTAPKAQLDVVGTISGSRLSISNNANISGSLLVLNNITARGTISGAILHASSQLRSSGTLVVGGTATFKGTIENGLAAWFPMDTSTGSSTVYTPDLSVTAGSGRLVNGPTFATGKFGRTLSLDGTDDHVEITDADHYTFSNGFTSSQWVNFSTLARADSIIEKTSSATVREWGFGKYTDNKIYAAVVDETTDGFGGRSAPIPSVGAWHHVVMTYNGGVTNASVKIFVDGVQVDNADYGTLTGFISIRNTTAPVHIGHSNWLTPGYALGKIDDVRLYNRALSAREIADLYRSGSQTIGGTMSGVVILEGNASTLLNIRGTASGERLHANRLLTASGMILGESGALLDGGTFYVDAGNNRVGIGTMSPGTPLHIQSDASATTTMRTNWAGGTAGLSLMIGAESTAQIHVDGANSNALTFNTNSKPYIFKTGSSEFARFSSTGLVGIGTTAPKAKLDVFGTISGSRLSISNTANISGALLVKGNVGIGTTSPIAPLHVVNASNGRVVVETDSDTTSSTADILFKVSTNDSNNAIKSGIFFERKDSWGVGSLHLATSSAQDSSNVSLSDARLTISNGGLVGIGTTAPKAKLDVFGTISGSRLVISQNGAFSGSLVVKNTLSGSSVFGFGLGDCNNATTSKLIYNNSTGKFSCASDQTGGGSGLSFTSAEGIYVNQSGDTMTGALVINVTGGDINTVGLKVINTLSGAHLHAERTLSSSGSLVWEGTASGNTLRVMADSYFLGKLGIGVTNPTSKLTIGAPGAGNVAFNIPAENGNTGFRINRPLANNTKLEWYGSGVGVVGSIVDNSGMSVEGPWTFSPLSSSQIPLSVLGTSGQSANIFQVDPSAQTTGTYFNITSAGNIGINKVTPQAKLDVVGTISGSRLVISQNGAFSGSLVVKNTLSGSSVFGFGLGDCNNATTSKLIYNNSTGKFNCATDQTGGSGTFGTGNVLTISDARYVAIKGGSMTGSLQTPTINLSGVLLSSLNGFNQALNIGNAGYATNAVTRLDPNGNLTNIGSIQAGSINATVGGTFAAKVDYATGTSPRSVAIGDLNGDGKADLAVANQTSTTVSVFLNNGNGTFATKVDYATGTNPRFVAIGDFNGDGKADLAVANYSSATVSVFLNNGNGTFAAKADYTTGTNPHSVAIGDVNGDGKADLAVANYGSTTVSVLLNNGNGTFAAKVDYTTGTNPHSVAIGDVNGDGKADLAVANYGSTTVSVFMNNGNGTFAAKVDYTTGTSPISVAIGDLNGDGKADLAVANYNGTSVSVFVNNGDGTFAAKVDYTTGTQPYSVAIGDLNGDGKADLAVVNFGSTTVSALLNNGNGTFAAKVDYTTGSGPIAVAIGDVNGDGKADLAAANSSSNTVSVFLNNTRPVFSVLMGTGGTVGIGTAAPKAKLDVIGTISGSRLAVSGNANISGTLLSRRAIIGAGVDLVPTAKLNIIGTSDANQYRAIALANTTNSGTSKGAIIMGARKNNGHDAFVGYGTWDNGSDRIAYIGGGSWAAPDATSIQLFTASQYTEANGNSNNLRATVDGTGLRVWGVMSGTVVRAQNILSSSGLLMVTQKQVRGSGALVVDQRANSTGAYMTVSSVTNRSPVLVLENNRIGVESPHIVFGYRGTFDLNMRRSAASTLAISGSVVIDRTLTVQVFGAATATTVCRTSTGMLAACSSSLRYKEDVQDLSMGLDTIRQMRAVNFKWQGRDERDFGFIAEEMEAINPLFVEYDAQGQVQGVKYMQLTAVLTKAVQAVDMRLLGITNDSGSVLHAKDLLSSSGSLHVLGFSTFGSGILLDTSYADGRSDVLTIKTDVGGTDNTVFRVNASGAVFSDSTFNSQGADYAEWFKDGDANSAQPLQKGELVCVDILQNNTVRRCTRSADTNLMGIVSTNPAFIGNNLRGANGMDGVSGYALIGLIGQVPAKVLVESGAVIRPGDSLTAASVPGFARRAKAGESTVGVALEGYDGTGNHVINVLISRRNQSVTVETVEQKVLDSIASMNISDEVARLVETASNNLDLNDQVAATITQEIQNLNLTQTINTLITNRLSGALLKTDTALTPAQIAQVTAAIDAHTSTGDTLIISSIDDLSERVLSLESILSGSTLHAAAGRFGTVTATGFTLVSGTSSLDLTLSGTELQIGSLMSSGSLRLVGNLTVTGLATFFGNVEIRGELSVSGKQAGIATIPKSGTAVVITFSGAFVHTPIVTASSDDFAPWRIRNRSQTGFTIQLKDPAENDISFSWLAISSSDPLQTSGTATVTGPIVFPLDSLNRPVSTDDVWNSCIRGTPLMLASGKPVSCARYHDGYVWQHPDLGISFTYNPNHEPPILSLPDGYVSNVTVDVSASSSSSSSSESSNVSSSGSSVEVDTSSSTDSSESSASDASANTSSSVSSSSSSSNSDKSSSSSSSVTSASSAPAIAGPPAPSSSSASSLSASPSSSAPSSTSASSTPASSVSSSAPAPLPEPTPQPAPEPPSEAVPTESADPAPAPTEL